MVCEEQPSTRIWVSEHFPAELPGLLRQLRVSRGSKGSSMEKLIRILGLSNVFPKVDDPRKFAFPCSIAEVEFKKALCDSGSSVNLVSKAIVDKLGIADVEPSQVTLAFANSSTAVPYGTIRNLPDQVGDCSFHSKYQVVQMHKDYEMPLIPGRTFMATVGTIIDMPSKRVSFSNINKKVFYKVVSTRFHTLHASCISVFSGERLKIVPKKELGKNCEIKEVLDGDPHTYTKKLSGNEKLNEKVQKKRVKGDLTMIFNVFQSIHDTITSSTLRYSSCHSLICERLQCVFDTFFARMTMCFLGIDIHIVIH
ncbi:hypothetical protein N665_0077s0029 [Sinapis alba]|nr:hypothetical protein N665_0077s0029 [Sinapis alba]